MGHGETNALLEAITDEGLFERLATAVLRESDADYRLLAHTGLNAAGKTVKSPVDGIAFVPGAVPPHMIAVHHTISERGALESKWLHDPAKVKTKKDKPTAPPGDLIKAVRIFEEQKKKISGLHATLILTTNHEPSEQLVRDVSTAANDAGIVVKIFSRSVLSHHLDTDPNGQWVRYNFLGVPQERLSSALLADLSKQSVDSHQPPDEKALWVSRALDRSLADSAESAISFVVGESGSGKSIACYKHLVEHIINGGFGLVIRHEVLAEAPSLNHAIEVSLRQMHPSLRSGCGTDTRALASEQTPLLIVIEDVNRSLQPALLIEKLENWNTDKTLLKKCRIVCPVWPRNLAALGDELRQRVNALAIFSTVFSRDEGIAAVQRRHGVSRLEAEAISEALGRDPLLIALHPASPQVQPRDVIKSFIEGSLGRLAVSDLGEFTAAEYRHALRRLATEMLQHRQLNPTMMNVSGWFGAQDVTTMIRQVIRFGEVMRTSGAASQEQVHFRHDRVRYYLLADATADLMRHGKLPDDILTDPFFAEVLGDALGQDDVQSNDLDKLKATNPLALFCALRTIGKLSTPLHHSVLSAAENWLQAVREPEAPNPYLDWEALRVLSDIEASYVDSLVQRFGYPHDTFGLRASFRNGGVAAGIVLCFQCEPGVRFVGHIELIQFVQQRHPALLVAELDAVLRNATANMQDRIGALRLAGHLGDVKLGDSVLACWNADVTRDENLGDYLWATAQCCGATPKKILGPVCDAWAALSDDANQNGSSPRNSLAAHNIRWAFREKLPESSVKYFVERGQKPDLKAPITYLLNVIDHPDAVEFVARELAGIAERIEGTDSISPFAMSAPDEWKRRQEQTGNAMSSASKQRLQQLWMTETNSKHVRKAALTLWSSSIARTDLLALRLVEAVDVLADLSLKERVRRSDNTATALLMRKLVSDKHGYWWQFCRQTPSIELAEALDRTFVERGTRKDRSWEDKQGSSTDWITAELIMHLPQQQAEGLLLKHWHHLQYCADFVHAALFVATPSVAKAVAAAVAECPDVQSLFKHLTIHLGHKRVGHPGLSRVEQMSGIVPYLEHIGDFDILHLWEVCNDNGWLSLRRAYLDPVVDRKRARYVEPESAKAELDDMVQRDQAYSADRWGEVLAKAGWTADEVMTLLGDWLAQKKSLVAGEVASRAMIHSGRRTHLPVLKDHLNALGAGGVRLAENTAFAVMRRTLQ